MAPIPAITPHTVAAIYEAYRASNDAYDGLGINVGDLGGACDRQLYYNFRWASPPENIDGRKIRIFRRGDLEETRLIEDLERIGVEVFGQQERIRFVSGHVRGKIDGRAIGFVEAAKTEHLVEFKSSNHKNFVPLTKNGVEKEKPNHWVQLQLGMHALGLTRAAYIVTNKNDEAIYFERVKYDVEFCLRLLARAERIIRAQEPPARISDKPDYYLCKFCKHSSICHNNDFARVTCRSCIFSTPEMGGDGSWSCAKWNKPLSTEEQKDACPSHLYDPALVSGEQIDADEEANTVTYRLNDGRTWIDGSTTK